MTPARAFWAKLSGGGVPAAFAALLLFNIVVTPNFWELQTLYVNLTQMAPVAIVAVGMALVIATGGIDLSVGALMALAAALAPLIFLSPFGVENPALALAAAFTLPVAAAMLGGLFNGALVGYGGVQPIVATLILFISGRGIAQVLTDGALQTYSNPAFSYIGAGRPLGIPMQALLALAVCAAVSWLTRRTVFGRHLLAAGGNESAAALCGVPVRMVKVAAYALCAGLAGLAGLIVSAINSSSDGSKIGLLMELDAIAAAVVGGAVLTGGRAPIWGALLGAALVQLIGYTLLANGVPDEVALVVKAAVIVAAVAARGGRAHFIAPADFRILGGAHSRGVYVALAALVVFGALRYDRFLGEYNIASFLNYNTMFILISVGMCFVIVSGGIDLSVGAVAAMASVVAALLSERGLVAALPAGVAAGVAAGAVNAAVIVGLRVAPFIATLATMLAARGAALILSDRQTVSVSWESDFTKLGMENAMDFAPWTVVVVLPLLLAAWLILERAPFGRTLLAVGGGEESARLMGLKVDGAKIGAYLLSGACAGLAGVFLASEFGAGQPLEGAGWELSAIAAVVVGGALLTGGRGSIPATVAGALLLGLVFNVLNFENGLGIVSINAYWQSVIRGGFLLVVILLASGHLRFPAFDVRSRRGKFPRAENLRDG